MADRKRSSILKKRMLEINFGKLRKQFNDFNDDRKVFCNIYDMLMDAISDMENVENNLIWVSFNNQFDKEYADMQEISERFA